MADIWLILALWFVFIAYWLISAIGVKRDTHRSAWWRALAFRILVLLIVLFLVRLRALGSIARLRRGIRIVPANPLIEGIGVILCALGIAFAIWARWHLGRNWSAVPSLKEGHELVTSGPYAFVRHPIYTGILTAMLGSALTVGGISLIAFLAFVVCCIAFIRRVKMEERLMMQQFPDEYPAYRARTKALIPFVL